MAMDSAGVSEWVSWLQTLGRSQLCPKCRNRQFGKIHRRRLTVEAISLRHGSAYRNFVQSAGTDSLGVGGIGGGRFSFRDATRTVNS
ncbi:hypothetical protein [Laspinema palackyanum]|uniref:hypothetical protein n=1 Tax=Laspinema palackyanum TaxID=3231601 RepID=UPI00345DDE9B|nr:hypothetical protein [Laspinema sp. D2c]